MNHKKWDHLKHIRREFGNLSLTVEDALDSPIEQFESWFKMALHCEKEDPTAMVLSTSDEKGCPDSRVVLLKEIMDGQFVFYTNYESSKALQLKACPYAALCFYWPKMARQIRMRGSVTRTSEEQSNAYFSSRPRLSQISALASPQSRAIQDRLFLEQKINELIQQYGQKPLLRPLNWGGFMVKPDQIEFWQGRDNRLHDRILYHQEEGQWIKQRLAP